MCLICRGKVEVIDEYSDWTVRSAHDEFVVPAVLRLPDYSKPPPTHTKFCRENVYIRDEFSCQYCGACKPPRALTFDHVVPRSKGGKTSWTNIVTACRRCNHAKGDRSPSGAGMKLLNEPHVPSMTEMNVHIFVRGSNVPEQWGVWLGVDSV